MIGIIPCRSYDFLKIAIYLLIQYAQKLQIMIQKIHKKYVHLNSKHAKELKFGMYLSCAAPQIRCSDFENFASWPKTAEKSNMAAAFLQFSAIKWPKRENFQNHNAKFLQCY